MDVDYPTCSFCEDKNTKYQFITCLKPTCNVCGTAAAESIRV